MTPAERRSLWSDGTAFVVAETPRDATLELIKSVGENPDNYDCVEWDAVSFINEDSDTERERVIMTAAEIVSKYGVGLVASENY